MKKKTRLLIVIFCVICFVVVTPILILYSMGDRFDFKKMKITATGGIYVRTFPAADMVTIDSEISQKPGFLAQVQGQGSVFVQSLIPQEHTVLVKKNNYYDYFKTIPVKENEVTKLENIMLIKKSIGFASLTDDIDNFSVAPNNQNIITATVNTKGVSFNYSTLNTIASAQTFPITQTGKILSIKWSDDSSKALIEMQTLNNNLYYLFDSTLKKPSITKISYLDKNTQQVSFNPQDSKQIFFLKNNILYSDISNKTSIVIKNLETYKIFNNSITWLSPDGFLYNSDILGSLNTKMVDKNVPIAQNYQIFNFSGKTFLQADNSLFLLNIEAKKLQDINPPIANYKIIPFVDSNNNLELILQNSKKIYLYSFEDKKFNELYSGSSVNDCQMVNNSYIIFTDTDKIIISEIDYRGNINSVTLPQTTTIKSDINKSIEIKNPKIFFNQQDGKLYVLTDKIILLSDKITP